MAGKKSLVVRGIFYILIFVMFALGYRTPVQASSYEGTKIMHPDGTNVRYIVSSVKSVKSSNTSIVKATRENSHSIKLEAKKTGTVTITLTKKNGKEVKYYVLVTDSDDFDYSSTSMALKKGKTKTVKATAPKECTVKYKSSNKKIATVSKNGKITAKKAGTAYITATCYYKGTQAGAISKCVYVTNKSPYSYDNSAITLSAGKSKTVKASVIKGFTVKYSSSDKSVATVSKNGKIKGVSTGRATISAKIYYRKDLVKTYKKTVDVKSKYSYSVYLIGPKNQKIYSGTEYCFYIKTKNTSAADLKISGADKLAGEDYIYDDISYVSKSQKNGFYKVSDGYVITLEFPKSGSKTVTLKEKSLPVASFKVQVLDYNKEEAAWADNLITKYTKSSMTPFEKMDAICDYLTSDASGFTYFPCVQSGGYLTYVNLAMERGPYFVTKRWDSFISPSALALIAERIGEFTYIHNCYGDYSIGSAKWYATHYYCKVGVGDKKESYSVCPLNNSGKISSVHMVNFKSTSDVTKLT